MASAVQAALPAAQPHLLFVGGCMYDAARVHAKDILNILQHNLGRVLIPKNKDKRSLRYSAIIMEAS